MLDKNNRNVQSHESWGMVGLSRACCGGPQQLFGSDVTNHTVIILSVKTAQKTRDLGRDWIMGDDTICEVAMSPNQFAELISNMNVGDGVPCTITYTQQQGNIQFKPENNKLVTLQADRFKTDEEMMHKLSDAINQLKCLISTNKMPKGVGEQTVTKLRALQEYLDAGGSDFLRNQAKREIADMIVEAKTQVSEYVNQKIYSIGLENVISASQIEPELLEEGEVE